MTPFDVFARSLDPSDPDYPVFDGNCLPGVCCLTGRDEAETVPREMAIKPSFTQIAFLRAPDSDRVALSVFRAMTYKWQRMSSWVVDGSFVRLDRAGVRNAVFGGARDKPWLGYCTTSYKKHGILLASVNPPNSLMQMWAFENERVRFETEQASEWYAILRSAQDMGISAFSESNPVMLTLSPEMWLIEKIGFASWSEFEAWARPKYRTRLYRFLVYLLPSQADLNESR